jgi:uncharacterized membrane protein
VEEIVEETMNKKTISMITIIVGVIVTLVSLIADFIGIGSYPGINNAQLAGIAIGLVIVLVGLYLLRAEKKKTTE